MHTVHRLARLGESKDRTAIPGANAGSILTGKIGRQNRDLNFGRQCKLETDWQDWETVQTIPTDKTGRKSRHKTDL